MKKIFIILLLITTITSTGYSQLFPVLGGQRAGISSAQFLKIGVGGRAAAMGESFIAVSNDVSSLYWNPAALVQFSENQAIFSHTEWLVDIKHEFGGIVYRPDPNWAFGLSLVSLHMSDMKVTTETMPFGTGEYFKFGDVAVGLSVSHKFTDKFSFGGTVKYIRETLDKLNMSGVLVDFGTYYWTGLGTSRFAVTVSNFGNDLTPKGEIEKTMDGKKIEFQSFSPPTIFRIGLALEPYETDDYRITTSIQLNHPNDNSENVGLGIEASWKNILYVRGGYKINVDEQDFTMGAGVSAPLSFAKISFDYAYAKFSRLGNTHRFSIILGIF